MVRSPRFELSARRDRLVRLVFIAIFVLVLFPMLLPIFVLPMALMLTIFSVLSALASFAMLFSSCPASSWLLRPWALPLMEQLPEP